MTYRNLRQALDREGVQAIVAKGDSFDPTWHEAVGTVRHQDAGVKPQTVTHVIKGSGQNEPRRKEWENELRIPLSQREWQVLERKRFKTMWL